ncbi:Cobyric acid synthase [hydrothermal vent metagenome]|uniref:Cobyric acid synthase n=1 Tax=hydrothermal vent metagenome TaxID=652676 RepID=A0A3B1DFM2_9ZZZZ
MPAKTIMVQGTASDVGKSIVVTALCRMFKRRGLRVAPFKAQNMSNNSYVTSDGGEIGRAQAVQAMACGVEPSIYMNPILLKPNTDKTSQVIILGKVFDTVCAQDYFQKRQMFMKYVQQALDKLRQDYDIVVIEGAGSPAEINLKENDIVNMAIAKMASSPVILVGDIDKGGVFAQIVGTFELLDDEEKGLVKTFLINKFRGDKDLFMPGLKWIENKIQRKALGVLPMIPDLGIEQEDAVVLEKGCGHPERSEGSDIKILIHIIHLPRISNFTDFDSLSREQDVTLHFIKKPDRNIIPDLLIIPGTKSTIGDLDFLKRQGFKQYIQRCLKAGTCVLGICGGYQMLGQYIKDPYMVESNSKETEGLKFLPIKTSFSREKITEKVKAVHLESQLEIEGYEIHMGRTKHFDGAEPLFKIIEREGESAEGYDGVVLNQLDKNILGTYIHGLFDQDKFRRYFINKICALSGLPEYNSDDKIEQSHRDLAYDRLADEFEKCIDQNVLNKLLEEQCV